MVKKNFENQIIWIIGASSGIGKSLSHALAIEGAQLALSARRGESLKLIKDELSGHGHAAFPCDVANLESLEICFSQIIEKFKRLDMVIFLPALYASDKKNRESLDFIEKSINVNLMGAYRLKHIVTPYFERQGHGKIVFCASVAGYIGLPQGQPYSSTKAALINYSESLKIEMKDKNVDVQIINPGFVKTELTDKNDFEMPMIISPEKAAKYIVKGLQSKRFEIAFPPMFIFIMKILRSLPYSLYFKIAEKMKKDER